MDIRASTIDIDATLVASEEAGGLVADDNQIEAMDSSSESLYSDDELREFLEQVAPVVNTDEYCAEKITPSTNDVICGKGGIRGHPGNVKFRDYCDHFASQFLEAPSSETKEEVARKVVSVVHGDGGRFLKKNNGEWTVADFDAALKKAEQRLADIKKASDKAKPAGKKRSHSQCSEDDGIAKAFNPARRYHRTSYCITPTGEISVQSPCSSARCDVFEELSKLCENGNVAVSLVGSAGVGKSYLADIFTSRWLRQHQEQQRCTFWVRATSNSSLRCSLVDILDQVIESRVYDDLEYVETQQLAAQVWSALARMPRSVEWILVVDDIPEDLHDNVGLHDVLKSIVIHLAQSDFVVGRVLLTSRHDSCGGDSPWAVASKINVASLPDSASESLFLDLVQCRSEETVAATRELVVHHFEGLPMAIVTAAAEIVSSGVTVKQYLESLPLKKLPSGSDSKIDAILDSAIHHARAKGFGNVLDVVAWLNPDRVKREMIAADDATVATLCDLKILSTCGYNDPRFSYFCIHCLVQGAARRTCGTPKAAIMSVRTNGLDMFSRHNRETWRAAVQMLPHVDSIRLSISQWKMDQDSVGKVALADLLCQGGHVAMLACCDYVTARANYEAALVLYTQAYSLQGDDCPNTRTRIATTKKDLGRLHQALGEYRSARALYTEVLCMMPGETKSNKSPVIATTLHNLGRVCLCLGERIEAEQNFHKALQMKLDVNASPTSIALTMAEIGRIHQTFCRYREALEQFDAIEGMDGVNYRSMFGATTFVCHGQVYQELGDLSNARLKYEQALQVFDQVLGMKGKNEAAATAHCHLGSVLIDIGDLDGAHAHLDMALEMMKHLFGASAKHDNIASVTYHVGRLYEKRGDHETAGTKYLEAKLMLDDLIGNEQTNLNINHRR